MVELLVVISIIGILASVALPALFKNIEKAKIAELESQISAIRSAVLTIYADTTVIYGGTESDNILQYDPYDINSKSEVYKELEGFNIPFGGTYRTVKVGNKLLLEIKPVMPISKSGAKRLRQNIGDNYVNGGGDSIHIDEVEAIKGYGNPIYIKLIQTN